MPEEIEYKFLVDKSALPDLGEGVRIVQGYVEGLDDAMALRFRIKGDQGYVTLKIAGDDPAIRDEYEMPTDSKKMQEHIDRFCADTVIDKTRYLFPYEGYVWEIDIFHGRHAGLILAEIELPSADIDFAKPDWAGEDVTADMAYANAKLAKEGWQK